MHSAIIARIKQLSTFSSPSDETRILSGLRWLGLFSANEKVLVRGSPPNLLDTLCGRLEVLCKYEDGERDMVVLQHRFGVEWADGRKVRVFFFILSSSLPFTYPPFDDPI